MLTKKAQTSSKRLKPKVKTKKRNPLVLPDFYRYVRDKASELGCECHHFLPRSHLKQDIFLSIVPVLEHREIHAVGNSQTPIEWAMAKGFDVLVDESMAYFEEWAIDNDFPDEYFELIEDLRKNPFDAADIARNFIRNNRSL